MQHADQPIFSQLSGRFQVNVTAGTGGVATYCSTDCVCIAARVMVLQCARAESSQ